jgi:nucleotide-binding universal stress UspA family protein
LQNDHGEKITSSLYKKILVATDGSEHTEMAINHAIELAKLTGAQLHAVYVVSIVSPPENLDIKTDYDAGSSVSIDASMDGLKKILKFDGEKAIRSIEEKAAIEDIQVRKWILEGQPAKEILRLAQEQSFDLIVMGTLGRSGIEKFMLGSVADKVIRGSRIPVLTVRK